MLHTEEQDARWLLEEKYHGVAIEAYEADLKRLAAGEPLAYVIGSIPFLGLTIALDSHPLIPRPETEWWTEQMLSVPQNRGDRELSALDLCTGSGAIGCAMLARLSNAHVFFGEIDAAHKATIQKNIRENKLDESRADIRIGDLFEPFSDLRFDLIAINPPYIPSGRLLPPSVTRFEPAEALYAGEDGLALIRRIAEKINEHLTPTGTAWIECDRDNAAAAETLFTAQGFKTRLCSDQYHIPRFIVVSFA